MLYGNMWNFNLVALISLCDRPEPHGALIDLLHLITLQSQMFTFLYQFNNVFHSKHLNAIRTLKQIGRN